MNYARRDPELHKLQTAIAEVRPHVDAWIYLLSSYVDSLPPDTQPTAESDGTADRSYAEHELRAMKRDLVALVASTSNPGAETDEPP